MLCVNQIAFGHWGPFSGHSMRPKHASVASSRQTA